MSYRKHTMEALPTDLTFIPALSTVLTHLVSLSPQDHGMVTRFHAVQAPNISVAEYLNRIFRYFGCSNECFVLCLVYIDRIVKLHNGFCVSVLNVHRLLVTAVMLAAKFFDDVYYSNAYYARVGGVKTKELNSLEARFLSLIRYQLFVSSTEYEQYRQNVLYAVKAERAYHSIEFPLSLDMNGSQDENVENSPESYPTSSNVPSWHTVRYQSRMDRRPNDPSNIESVETAVTKLANLLSINSKNSLENSTPTCQENSTYNLSR